MPSLHTTSRTPDRARRLEDDAERIEERRAVRAAADVIETALRMSREQRRERYGRLNHDDKYSLAVLAKGSCYLSSDKRAVAHMAAAAESLGVPVVLCWVGREPALGIDFWQCTGR